MIALVVSHAGATKLNLGCGLHVCRLPGWENIDNSPNARLARRPWLRTFLYRVGLLSEQLYRVPWPSDIRILDVAKTLPYPDNSIEVIYASHMLEHLSRADALQVIRGAHRVLRPGGILRVVVPDLERLVADYLHAMEEQGGNREADDDSTPGDQFVSRLQLVTPPRRRVWGIPVPARLGSFHRWMYDFASVKRLLHQGGFPASERRTYFDSAIPEISELEVAERASESLYVEARKA